jgi:hypothetical protein
MVWEPVIWVSALGKRLAFTLTDQRITYRKTPASSK